MFLEGDKLGDNEVVLKKKSSQCLSGFVIRGLFFVSFEDDKLTVNEAFLRKKFASIRGYSSCSSKLLTFYSMKFFLEKNSCEFVQLV